MTPRVLRTALRRLRHRGPAGVVARTRLHPLDLLAEAHAGILQRPGRSALTALGTVLGVGTFVAILGLTATASSQIDARFNTLVATEVTIEDIGGDGAEHIVNAFPDDAPSRMEKLNGVRHAGVYWHVDVTGGSTITAAPVGDTAAGEEAAVVAATPGVLAAADPTLSQGRTFDAFHQGRAEDVVVIGSGLADRLGITTLETQPAVFIGGTPLTVIGIVDDVARQEDLLLSVIVPSSTAEKYWGGPARGERAKMLVSTRLGAATQIAQEAALALDPAHPDRFKSIPPPDPRTLRGNVSGDLDQLLLLLAGICLVIGTVGIANTTLVAVLERTAEIGVRRALGARARHITAQFLTESGALGALGGLVGTSLGTLTVVGVAVARDWTPIVHPATVAAAPLIGLATGLLAGLYPAWRASGIQPVEALRR
ncbi:ABC transporter permease [Streptomyces sp. NBC_00525]|uniref:ABC transporter permease n=1 Tax=Streptomyces sp. NBC_00525 TaxID=2903660 RepID=UPI002E8198D3|nr:ABC transporter permease [Streptomyces sp. NBC_00525]WUC95109.1 ABC transporter permease [Streptomyces sp. NBC_00525]